MGTWTRKPVADYIGKSYLSAGNSLHTIDWSTNVQLLNNYNDTKSKANVTKEKHDEISHSILFSGTNLLSKKECNQIVQTCVEQKLQQMETQYKSGRNNSRLIVFDSMMTNYIWQKLQTTLDETIDCTKLVPLGFDVLRGDWKLSGANEAIRFNQYNCKKNEFFSVHRDSQFCPSGDERSVFSIVIYLNDGYSGGETVFYFPKDSSIESKGLDISEEIAKNQGLDEGYEKVIIKPKCGNFVIFTPNILHESLKIEDNDNVQNKYIIKTDIMMKRSGMKFGFSLSLNEQDDYFQCLKTFRDAQSHELDNLHEDACKFYEICLSIRYSYPTKEMILEHSERNAINYGNNASIEIENTEKEINVISTVMEDDQKEECNSYQATSHFGSEIDILTADIWLKIMLFLGYIDIENLTIVFPHLSSFKRMLYKAYIIPSVELRDGVFTKFTYKSYDFVKNNIEGCCRVLAIYSVYLLGHSPDNNTYTVNYNPETNEVTSIPLYNLLYCVFYEEPSYGSIFKVMQGDGLRKNEEKDFFNSVDRYFMLLRYGKEFLGVDVAEEFCCNLKTLCNNYHCMECNGNNDGEIKCHINEVEDDVYLSTPKFERDANGILCLDGCNFHTLCRYDRMHGLYKCSSDPHELVCIEYSKTYEGIRKYIYFACEKIKMIDKSYDKQIISAATNVNNVGAAIVRRLTKKIRSIKEQYECICGIGHDIPSSIFSDACNTVTFNHLIFDFDQQKLKVYEETNEVEEAVDINVDDIDADDIKSPSNDKCCFLASFLRERVKCSFEDLGNPDIFGLFKVNIEAICGDEFSFNHAGCQCFFPSFEVNDYLNLQSYPYLNHLHTLFVKNEKFVGDEEVSAWTCYGGIVCL